ncbi:MAG: aminopeptidase P family protein, partial [Bacteroidetes bacterium]
MFPTATYTARRGQLCKDLGQGLIFFPGNSESPVNYAGNVYPFRQDSNFLYFIGIDQPGLAATLDAATGEAVLYGNELSLEDIVWTGPLPTLKELAERVGITKVRPMSELGEALSGLTPHFTPPYRFDTKIWLSELLWIPVREVKNHVSEALIHAIIRQRAYKSAEEIAQIETAVNISRRMHLAAMTHARAGMTEAELMA